MVQQEGFSQSASQDYARIYGSAGAAAIALTVRNINSALRKLQSQKTHQRAEKAAIVIQTSRKLADQSARAVRTQTPSADKNGPGVEAMTAQWKQLSQTLADSSDEDRQHAFKQMQSIRQELGDAGLASALISSTQNRADLFATASPAVDKASINQGRKPIGSELQPASVSQICAVSVACQAIGIDRYLPIYDIKRTPPAAQPTAEMRGENNSLETLSKRYLPDGLAYDDKGAIEKLETPPSAANRLADSPTTPVHTQTTYLAEAYAIYQVDNKTTVTDLSGKVLFEFVQASDGSVTVTTDKITGNSQTYGPFAHAHKNLAAAQKMQTMLFTDSTRRTQANALGDLAPRGAHAISLCALITNDSEPTITYREYVFKQTYDGLEVGRTDGHLIAAAKNSQQIQLGSTEQTAEDYQTFKENFQRVQTVAAEREAADQIAEQARTAGNPISHSEGLERE